MNDTKLVGNLILPICPHCNEVIADEDVREPFTTNITNTNPQGETNLYHTECIQSIYADKIQDEEQSWGEEPIDE